MCRLGQIECAHPLFQLACRCCHPIHLPRCVCMSRILVFGASFLVLRDPPGPRVGCCSYSASQRLAVAPYPGNISLHLQSPWRDTTCFLDNRRVLGQALWHSPPRRSVLSLAADHVYTEASACESPPSKAELQQNPQIVPQRAQCMLEHPSFGLGRDYYFG